MAYPTDVEIQAVMDARKLNRMGALQFLRRQGKKVAAPVVTDADVDRMTEKEARKLVGPQVTKVVKVRKPKAAKPAVKKAKRADLPKSSSEQVKVDREKLDSIIRASLKSAYGKVCPVLGVLGQRFTVPSQKSGYPFYRVLVDTPDGLMTNFVSGFYDGNIKTSLHKADPKSYTVKTLLARIARKTKRAADALAKGAK
jgi:hypothetical protein